MQDVGKVLILFGMLLVVAGLFFTLFKGNIPRLPGDILIKTDNTTVYIPIVTSIVLSIIITIILNIFFRK